MYRYVLCTALILQTIIGSHTYAQQAGQIPPSAASQAVSAAVQQPTAAPALMPNQPNALQVPAVQQPASAQQTTMVPAAQPTASPVPVVAQPVIAPAQPAVVPVQPPSVVSVPAPDVSPATGASEVATKAPEMVEEAIQVEEVQAPQEAEQEIDNKEEKEIEEKGEPEPVVVAEVSQGVEQSPGAVVAPVQEEAIPEIVGIDTVNVESASGNWLLKRIWFERAQEQYEKIKSLFDKVLELRLGFFTKRSELDRMMFEPFYLGIGIGQGELLEILSRLLQDLEEIRKESGALNAQENVLFETVEKEKATLEQLQKDVTGVTELDAALEAAIAQLIEQVNVCRGYEKQAWETFKEIGKQLSDKKARELYYAMDTYRKNSADIVTYLQRDFANYIRELERKAHEQIDRIMTTLKALKEKNIDFKQQAQRLEQKRHAKVEEVQEEQEVEIEPQGIVGRIWSSITSGVSTLWEGFSAGVSGLYHWIWPFGSSESNEEVDEA